MTIDPGEGEVGNQLIPARLTVSIPVLRQIPDLSNEITLLGDFPVASGAFSTIWLGKLARNQLIAGKILHTYGINDSKLEDDIAHEAHVWSLAMPHENILPLLGVARLNNSVALISPWQAQGDLSTFLKQNHSANKVVLLAGIARGLAYLHERGIIYGYLTATTVLVSDNRTAYLSSFLFSRLDGEVDRDEESWISPYGLVCIKENDVFAFGLLAAEILLETPSRLRYPGSLLDIHRKIHGYDEQGLGLPKGLIVLIRKCLERDESSRPTMAEIVERMLTFVESFNPQQSDAFAVVSHPVKDISSEVRKISDHPIAGGGYCDLYLGERLGERKVALKLVRLFGSTDTDKDATRRRFLSEVRVWSNLKHPRILEFSGICEYGTLSLFMVSPFLSNGNIMSYLNKINPQANRRRLLIETAEGLAYLHGRNPPVIHGDMKGANILISDEGSAVLADFGLSRISHEATSSVLRGAGSPRWMAPELVISGDIQCGPLRTIKSDAYGFGHVLLEVLSNQKPFANIKEDLHVLVELIKGRRPQRPTGEVVAVWLDDSAWSYCQACTNMDPDCRPDMGTVVTDLRRIFRDIN